MIVSEMSANRTPGVWYKRLLAFLQFDCIGIIWVSVIALVVELTGRAPVLQIQELEKRTGCVAVITGGPRGLALGLIKRLLELDYAVIMGVRSINDSKTRLEAFAKSHPSLPVENVTFLEMDLMSLKSMRQFAEMVLNRVERIDLLLCNAANMNEPYNLTEDGLESQFQVNYLSNFLLTQLLLTRIKATAQIKGSPCHVIYSSSVVSEVGKFHFEEMEQPLVYSSLKFYSASKLSQVTSVLYLEKKLEEEKANVHFYAVHPGLIPTDLWYTGMGYIPAYIGSIGQRFFRTIDNGADTILWPAFSPEFQNRGGVYMANGEARRACGEAQNEINQLKLYEMSMEIIQTKR